MVEIRAEKWKDCQKDISELCVRHWEEIAHNKELIKLNPDWEKYQKLDDVGMISVTTARENKKLIGYQIYIVMNHLHYKDSLTAMSDVLYLVPEHRKGMVGIRLMKLAEEVLKGRGVQRVLQNVKFTNDWGVILERMGYKPFERIYSKILGE